MDRIPVTREQMRQCIRQEGLVAIIRGGFTPAEILTVGDAMLAAPVHLLEVTLNTPDALGAIASLRTRFGSHMVIGAGTVRDAAQTRVALEAGAQFLVAPNLDLESLAIAEAHDVLMVPGVFTPTEAQTAARAGCRMVKLFPCLGPSYLKAIRAPLSDMEFVPTGGIDADNIGDFRQAGAVGVGIGSALINAPPISQADLITKARRLLRNWHQAA